MKKARNGIAVALLAGVFMLAGCDSIEEEDGIGSVHVFKETPQNHHDQTIDGDESIPEGYVGEDGGEVESVVIQDDLWTEESARKEHETKLAALAAKVTGASNDLADLVTAQLVTYTDEIKSDGWDLRDGTTQRRTTHIQTNYYVYSVYSFDSNRDYYLVQQEIIIANGNLWGGMRKHYDFPAYYRSKDFWMSSLWTDNTISKGASVLGPNVLSISKYSPETLNGVTSYTEGMSWNIGGKVGLAGGKPAADLSGGVSFSDSHSWTVADIGVTAKVMDNLSTKNAKWQWDTNKKPTYNYSVDINDPADLAKSTAKFGASWIWVVEKPGKNDQYTLNAGIGGSHASTSFYSTGADMSHRYKDWSFNHSFPLDKPKRTE